MFVPGEVVDDLVPRSLQQLAPLTLRRGGETGGKRLRLYADIGQQDRDKLILLSEVRKSI